LKQTRNLADYILFNGLMVNQAQHKQISFSGAISGTCHFSFVPLI